MKKQILLLLVFVLYSYLSFAQWQQINGPYGGIVNCLAISGSNIFAGNYLGGVFLSSDNGASWTAVNNGLSAYTAVFSFAVSGSNIFAGTPDGVFLSANNGVNWEAVNTGLNRLDVTGIPAGLYFLRLFSANDIFTEKIILQ
ncbi:MAG: T9SS type A sorting domain-containing protein [Bacteroidia bacterium]|nr:T9SS type A sorting domain-containing protein [Bacteroidia bacterium]